MVINMYRLTLCFIIYIVTACIANAQENDFDKICSIYSTVLTKKMDAKSGSKYINDSIKSDIHDKDVIEAHNNIYVVSQEKRYPVFKEIAEHALNKDWNCAAMKQLLNHPPK